MKVSCLAPHVIAEQTTSTGDGVIKDRVNIRQWIFEQAAYIMCDFCIQGGKFFIKPSFLSTAITDPQQQQHAKGRPLPVEIKALFTDGNVRNARMTFLPPEERQMFTAQVIYRAKKLTASPSSGTKLSALSKPHDYDAAETMTRSALTGQLRLPKAMLRNLPATHCVSANWLPHCDIPVNARVLPQPRPR